MTKSLPFVYPRYWHFVEQPENVLHLILWIKVKLKANPLKSLKENLLEIVSALTEEYVTNLTLYSAEKKGRIIKDILFVNSVIEENSMLNIQEPPAKPGEDRPDDEDEQEDRK